MEAGIDLTKRKSGMHFFEMQVETKKNQKLKIYCLFYSPFSIWLRKIVLFILGQWEAEIKITEA